MHSMRHIILNTGQDIRSRREEVNDVEVALLQSLLARAVTGERVASLGTPLACTITAEDHAGALFAKVWIDTAVLVAIGVADNIGSEAMWRHMHDVAAVEEITHTWPLGDRPPAPWCVALRFPAAPLYRDAMSWIGDLEVCIAWAWLERTA